MYRLTPLFFPILLAACGMKGNLYEPASPAATSEATEATEPTTNDTDPGERKKLPSIPDPAKSQ